MGLLYTKFYIGKLIRPQRSATEVRARIHLETYLYISLSILCAILNFQGCKSIFIYQMTQKI
jgi:hypothetical protein